MTEFRPENRMRLRCCGKSFRRRKRRQTSLLWPRCCPRFREDYSDCFQDVRRPQSFLSRAGRAVNDGELTTLDVGGQAKRARCSREGELRVIPKFNGDGDV